MTEEQAWKLFNDEVMAMAGPDKAGRGIMAVVAAARAEGIEAAAQIADQFKCGGCGMDGKAAEAIRALAKLP